MRKPAELCLRMVAELAVAARQCRCAQACKSAALHCNATHGGRWFYGEDKRIGGSEMQRLPRPEGKAGNVWLAWHGSRGVRRGVWLPATAAAGCRRRRVSRGGGVEGLRRRSLPRPMGTGKQSRQRDMNARTTTSTRPAGSGRGATPRILTGQCARAPASA